MVFGFVAQKFDEMSMIKLLSHQFLLPSFITECIWMKYTFGHIHLSVKIHNVEFHINVLRGEMIHQNLMSKILMSTYHSVAMIT